MKAILILSFVFLSAAFFGVYVYNSNYPPLILQPPYPYTPGELVSEAYALLFVFITSFLFFGFSAPIGLGVEAAKHASLYSTNAVSITHIAFMLPAFFAAVSATYLGQGLLKDYQGEGLWHQYAQKSAFYLGMSLVSWLFVYFGRNFVGSWLGI